MILYDSRDKNYLKMQILNDIPERKYIEAETFLAFLGIYEDKKRERGYKKGLKRLKDYIKGKTCIEAGAGFGIFSEYLVKLGAKKVYAIESNRLAFNVLKENVAKYEQIIPIRSRIENFKPREEISLLIHDFFGNLLYDESLFALENLKFKPKRVFPNRAKLRYAVVDANKYYDDCITKNVIKQLSGMLISDLFLELKDSWQGTALEWQYPEGLKKYQIKLPYENLEDLLLVFGLQIYDDDLKIAEAGKDSNWSLVWTPVDANIFNLDFKIDKNRGYVKVKIEWTN